MAARATLIFLYCVEWGYAIKTSLIVIISAMLLAAVGLLVLEIIGVKSSNVAPPQNVAKPEEPPLLLMPSAPLEQELAAAEDADDEQQPESELELAAEAVLVDDAGGAEAGTVIVGESELKVGYNRSFTAKLVQSEDPLKGFYSVIKNELLRYGLKSRMSWSNESMYRGRKTYAKFAIRGKTLSLYLALDPAKFEDTKYNFDDAGHTAKYRDVPMRLKIKSDRAAAQAKELISVVSVNVRTELQELNFRPDYRDTASLVREGLIKLYYLGDDAASKEEKRSAAVQGIKKLDKTPRDFTTKLMRADSELKTHYSAIKNELLRYGLKQRMSTGNESWYRGRTTYAKFAIRGKTLSLYMALDPDEFEGTKYNFRDTGNVNKYGKVPMRMKIKSDRSVRWVKELIATMAEKKGWSREELEEKDFRYVKKRKKR